MTADSESRCRPERSAMVADDDPAPPRLARLAWAGAAVGRSPLATALAPPTLDPSVVAREQDLGDAPAAVDGRARVMRVLGVAAEGDAERLLSDRAGVTERARQLAQHRVA